MIIVKKKKTIRERLKEVDQKLTTSDGRKRDLEQQKMKGYSKTRAQVGVLSSPPPAQEHHGLIGKYIKSITTKNVHYNFHKLSENTIAHHVRQQLHNRIINATPDEKDLYFLTAFLDRSALDSDVQNFRNTHPHFKDELIQCWNEDSNIVTRITSNIESTINLFKNDSEIDITPTMEKIYHDAPGRFKFNQILICLKVVKDIYELSKNTNISHVTQGLAKEKQLRNYLLRLYGVHYKLANWSISNVTGHWFVVDMHIQNAINKYLRNTLSNIKIDAKTADEIFARWFGVLDENNHQYSHISQEQFIDMFPDYLPMECEYLPFIMTQYLWFHGKYFLAREQCN